MRRDHGLTMARYDVLAHLDLAGGRLGRKARKGHHEFMRRTFGDALDDRELADLTRVMSRLGAHVS